MSAARGFTLLEMMISVAIAAVGIVSVLELFSGSTRLARMSVRQTEALIVARSLMDEQMWQTELDDGEESGTEGDFRYRIRVEQTEPRLGVPEDMEPEEEEEIDYELKRIDVAVSWATAAGERQVELSTLRLLEIF